MKPRDRADGLGCAGADRSTATMTSSISVDQHQPPTVPLLQQQQQQTHRRHIERPIRVWPFAMECLAETETEADTNETTEESTTDGRQPQLDNNKTNITQQQPTSAHLKRDIGKTGSNQSQQSYQHQPTGLDGSNKRVVEADTVGCAPFFGVKHYLHNFYGLPDDDTSSKIWRQIEAENEEDYFAILTSGQGKSEVECWHVHRRCFAWSVSIGSLMIILGLTCLLLGFLLPRHPVLVSQMEENDLKMWIAAHTTDSEPSSISSLNILDRKAVEHNNILDILKVGGMMATCMGVLLLVIALIFPPGRHPSTWADEDDTPHISQINQALKNCLRSVHSKNHPTFFYSGLVASTTDEKIPVFQQVQSVQPKN